MGVTQAHDRYIYLSIYHLQAHEKMAAGSPFSGQSKH